MHEVELGVVISKKAKQVSEVEAMNYVLGYVLALDMTINLELEKYPILLLKSFDTSCPISNFIPKEKVLDVNNLDLKLKVNGQLRHDGNTRDMIRKIPKLIAHLSKCFTLERGDLILTGTPSGISTVRNEDVIEASLGNNLAEIKFSVSS
jgi:acylpyruvate hydrolase